MNLMNAMLAFDPTHRLSVAEIIAHNWWKGPVSKIEDIQKEFAERKVKVDLGMEQQKIQKEKDKKVKAQPPMNMAYKVTTK